MGFCTRIAARRRAILLSTLLCSAVASPLHAGPPRVDADLQVLYVFDKSEGDTIRDRSGVGEPLDLKIENAQAVAYRGQGLSVLASTKIASAGPAGKVIDAVKKSGQLTIEVWVKPPDDRQTGPARIVSLSADASLRNVTLGQDAARYDTRLRTEKTTTNGMPSTATPEGSLKVELTHVVFARDAAGAARFYLNGQTAAEARVEGGLGAWSDDYRLLLANEGSGDRPWRGQLYLVAIYSRALTADEVSRNYAVGAPGRIDYAALLPKPAEREVDFVSDVQPILRQHCFECHSQGNEKGGLNLGLRARVVEGGKNGPVLIRGASEESPLIHRVAALDPETAMPPEGDGERLTDEQVGILRAWIDHGAAWPSGADVLDPRLERAKEHWAFQPLQIVATPDVKNPAWCRTPIDRFILAGLEANALRPAPPLTPRKLIRRLYYDVIGLPPSPDEVDAFVRECELQRTDGDPADAIPRVAVENLVDRLLASQHYGERWGRHWLDVARYADSDGQEGDQDRPGAFYYRDFVIRALNDDMPFDQFVRWQLAGDEYEPDNPLAVAATGFLVAGSSTRLEDKYLEEERLRNRYNELDDMLSTIGSAMLGLTIGCARCHDHKYDAISSREYYRMLSAVHSGDRAETPTGSQGESVLAFRDYGAEPRTTWLFERGDFYDRDQQVQLGFLAVASRGKEAQEYWDAARQDRKLATSTYQRRALAEWMTDPAHGAAPLVARVIVNRLWRHHFGEGLVRTASDFGVRGETPTHPELLDWLALDLVDHGWKLKRLHRAILTSGVYLQGTAVDSAAAATDPDNRLLWRMRPRRLEAEILRDAILAASGLLNLEPFGPGFRPPIAAEAMVARNLKSPYPQDAKDSPQTFRRSVYMFHKRVIPYPLFQAFDRPDSLQSCSRRETTTVAPQALALLNDPFVRARAADFAQRLLNELGEDDAACVDRAFQLALGRSPSEAEGGASLSFLAAQSARRQQRSPQAPAGDARRQAMTDFCQMVFGLNEFVYID